MPEKKNLIHIQQLEKVQIQPQKVMERITNIIQL